MSFLYGYIVYRNVGKCKAILTRGNSVNFIITGNTGDEFIICWLINKDIPFYICRKIYIEPAENTFHVSYRGNLPFWGFARGILPGAVPVAYCLASGVALIINFTVSIPFVSPYYMHNIIGYCYRR